MSFLASVNGVITSAQEARVSILDNGFTFGDSVYETLRTYNSRPFRLDLHLRRLRISAGRLGIDIPMDDPALSRTLDALLGKAANPESYIRLIVTRGVGDISYRFERVAGPTVVMAVKPFEPPSEAEVREGCTVFVVSIRRNHPDALDPAIKSCNLLNSVLAVREAQKKGGAEAILLNQRGEVAEGASSNIFIVKKDALLTPPLNAGILPGITRVVVLEIASRLGIPAREETVTLPALAGADEAFLTSTVREILPIRAVDGRPVGSGRPGPLTERVRAAFREYACGPPPPAGTAR
jgi:branched-chain amino acid aminotransferase